MTTIAKLFWCCIDTYFSPYDRILAEPEERWIGAEISNRNVKNQKLMARKEIDKSVAELNSYIGVSRVISALTAFVVWTEFMSERLYFA